MSKKEIDHMIRILPNYYEHLDTFKGCLIARMYGIFTIRIDRFEPIHVMILQNTLPDIPATELQFVFDIKGSTINREVFKNVTNESLSKNGPTGGKVLKDLDYKRLKEINRFMKLAQARVNRILKTLEVDVNFLTKSRFMDYSLLFSVRKVKQEKKKSINIAQSLRTVPTIIQNEEEQSHTDEEEEDNFEQLKKQFT